MSITCSQSVNGRQAHKPGSGALTHRLRQVRNPAPIGVLSDSEDLTHVFGVLNNGAKGYIPTSLPLEVAVEAIRMVAARGGAAGSQDTVKQIFTARQAAIVEGVRKGKANKTIAYELNLQESTVKVYIRNIMKKLNAKNRTEVAYIATNLENAGWL